MDLFGYLTKLNIKFWSNIYLSIPFVYLDIFF